MVAETNDVQNFIAVQALFQHLAESNLEYLSNNIYVAYQKSGGELEVGTGEAKPVGLVMVRSGSLEIRDAQHNLIDRLSAGDFFIPRVLAQAPAEMIVRVLEDCLYYELSESAFQSIRSNDEDISRLCDTYARSYQADTSKSGNAPAPAVRKQHAFTDSYLDQSVKDYMTAPAFCASPNITIRRAAQIMTNNKISSLLITEDERLVGIMTDRDLRTRVVAKGVADTEPVSGVMTPKPHCIDMRGRLHQAQLVMMSSGIHHLPVVDRDVPVGMLGMSDIMRANNLEPLSLTRGINNATTVTELAAVAAKLPDLVVKLIERDTRPYEVGEIITSLSDALTRRLLRLAETVYGKPPCTWAWLAFGSQARQEQMLGSDQDNALIYANNADDSADSYFAPFARFVNDGLDACGIHRCPGDIMAANPKWRMTLAGWQQTFNYWIQERSPKALMHASIFFDMRPVAGDLELVNHLRGYVLAKARSNTIFLALMTQNALEHSPPLGFFKQFVLEKDGDHNHTLDLKKRGTITIVDIARNYSLAAAISEVNTISRLQAMERAGVMSRELVASLVDAHEFIAGIRLQAQGEKFHAGDTVDNQLDPKTLSPLVRHQLKEAFQLVRQAQAAMKARFGGGVL